jgi:hypothetical protein
MHELCRKWPVKLVTGKRKNVHNEGRKERRKGYSRLKNELKRTTEKTKKEYLESIRDETVEFQRTQRSDLVYMKKQKLVWK